MVKVKLLEFQLPGTEVQVYGKPYVSGRRRTPAKTDAATTDTAETHTSESKTQIASVSPKKSKALIRSKSLNGSY